MSPSPSRSPASISRGPFDRNRRGRREAAVAVAEQHRDVVSDVVGEQKVEMAVAVESAVALETGLVPTAKGEPVPVRNIAIEALLPFRRKSMPHALSYPTSQTLCGLPQDGNASASAYRSGGFSGCCDFELHQCGIRQSGELSSLAERGVVCGAVRSSPLDRDLALDIVGLESDRLGGSHARQYRDVVELLDRVLEAQPFDDVAAVDVDDQQAAARDASFSARRSSSASPAKVWPRRGRDKPMTA